MPFDAAAHRAHTLPSRRSAAAAVPLVLDTLGPVSSLVDFGCGAGQWLAEFQAAGVDDLLGLEGGHPDDSDLQVPRDLIQTRDLTAPVDLGRRFDLAVSLEVGEHLPEAAAATFVRSLCAASDLILFSAAVPHQIGTGHINCQWQSWWSALFAAEGYGCYDPLRAIFWADQRVEWWYAQNTLVYSRTSHAWPTPAMLDVARPELVAQVYWRYAGDDGIPAKSRRLARAVKNKLRRP